MKEFMDWVKSLDKDQGMSTLLQEFEKRFSRISAQDRTMLDTSKVLLIVNLVDLLDRKKVGLLLEMDEGLTTDCDVVKRVYDHFDKRCDWNDVGS